jgi:hypothetical protein
MDPEYTMESATTAALKIGNAVSSTSSQSVQERFPYANYGDLYACRNDTDEYARKLFGSNYARLQEVKKKYDPDQVFSRWFAIQPSA